MSEQIADMTQIRDEYIEAWAGHFVRGKQGAARYFDQALNGHNLTIEAAAEQRGAVKALQDAAKDWRWSDWADAPRNPVAAANYVGDWIANRAEDLEGDE